MQNKILAQGDVLLVRTSKSTKHTTTVAPENGRIILARGEATGHHHSLVADEDTRLLTEEGGRMLLEIMAGTKTLEHQEHGPIILSPGTYEVRLQREYDLIGERRVTD